MSSLAKQSSSAFSLLAAQLGSHALAADNAPATQAAATSFGDDLGSPVIETPPAGARSVQDMLIQSWGDTIRVFPAVPDKWPDVSFGRLSTESAFTVSAVRKNGRTATIRIESRAGEPCKVATGMTDGHRVIGLDADQVTDHGGGLLSLRLQRGQSVTIVDAQDAEPVAIAPVRPTQAIGWRWGLNGNTAEQSDTAKK